MTEEGSGRLSVAPNSQKASSNESEPQPLGSTSITSPNNGKDDSEVEGFEREDTSPGLPWTASNQQELQEASASDRTSREPPRWRTRNILTCDGGGIRGYATALMIRALMFQIGILERSHSVRKDDNSFFPGHKPPIPTTVVTGFDEDNDGSFVSNFLPCHYFDYMFGTSTGGLIAVMLSRWRMSIGQCIKQYEVIGTAIFQDPRRFGLFGLLHDRHHKAPLVDAIQTLTELKTPKQYRTGDTGERFKNFPSPGDLCRTAVCAKEERPDGSSKGPYIFRSYGIKREDLKGIGDPLNFADSMNHEIYKVCRATSAAPMYFRPQVIDGKIYTDGADGLNNPTEQAIQEVREIHGHVIEVVASFGTGRREPRSQRQERFMDKWHIRRQVKRFEGWFQTGKRKITDCEETHGRIRDYVTHFANMPGVFRYFRFNVEEGLGKMKLDEYKPATFATIRACVEAELKKQEVQRQLLALAQQLVDERRDRITNFPGQWERFACGTSYECNVNDCGIDDGSRRERTSTKTRDEMKIHIQDKHSLEEDEGQIETRLNECRRNPEFPVGPW